MRASRKELSANRKRGKMIRRRHQKGCLTRKRGWWFYRFRERVVGPDGAERSVHRSVKLGLTREAPAKWQAEELLERWLKEKQPAAASSSRPTLKTLGEFIQEWKRSALAAKRASTAAFYEYILEKHILPDESLCKVRLVELTPNCLQEFINRLAQQVYSTGKGEHRKEHRYSPAVVHQVKRTLSTLLSNAVANGCMEKNQASRLSMPRLRRVRERVWYRPQDVRRILSVLDEPFRTMATLAAMRGLRASELTGLRWEDVDWEAGTLMVRRSFYRGREDQPKTEGSERSLPLGRLTLALLRDHWRRCGEPREGWMFASQRGKPYEPSSLVRRVLRPATESLGLPAAGWRAFRRSVGNALSQSLREPIEVAQKLMGHASARTTMEHYLGVSREEELRCAEEIEALMFPIVPQTMVGQEGLTH